MTIFVGRRLRCLKLKVPQLDLPFLKSPGLEHHIHPQTVNKVMAILVSYLTWPSAAILNFHRSEI